MTRAVYESLKRHIMKEREKKKQEKEQDELMERLKKERELRKKQEEENSLSLEATKEQINQLESKLRVLRQKKAEVFSQLKKALNNTDVRKTQQKEPSDIALSQSSAYQHPNMNPATQPMMMHGRPALYKPSAPPPPLTGMKRQRSPTPPPTSSTSYSYGHSESKYLHTSDKYSSHSDSKFPHTDPKYLATLQGSKGHMFTTGHPTPDFKSTAYQQASASHLYASTPSFQQQPGAGASYPSSQAGSNKYQGPSSSAFTSYQSHYAQSHAPPQKPLPEPFPAAFPIQRMQQPGYHASLQLQQSMDQKQAAQAAAVFEDKYKLSQTHIRSMVPSQQPALMTQALQIQQQQQQQQSKSTSNFVQGYPARSQAAPPVANYPAATSASNYSNPSSGQGRPNYGSQSHGRYY